MPQLINLWVKLRASLWFIPILTLMSAIVLALGLIEIDTQLDREWLLNYPRVFGLGADGSRGMLNSIASSMLTVAALTFALILNAMTQASGQFSPRVFRTFMRDRANQFVLGYFVGVFAYCLLVLRTIRSGNDLQFVPSLSATVGFVLALGGIIVLIFFIHHIADSLQLTTIISRVAYETSQAIGHLFPMEMGQAAGTEEHTEQSNVPANRKWRKISALCSGYVQSVDAEGMLAFSGKHRVILRMERSIGQFVGRGATLLSCTYMADGSDDDFVIDQESIHALNALFSIDRDRTIEQDVGFGIRQIVDIALKALSPGVNDTTTAVFCIDYLSEIVAEIARRQLPLKTRTNQHGALVLGLAPEFRDYVETAFDQIRINGRANLAIFERLFEALAYIAECTDDKKRRAVLEKQMALIIESADQTLATYYEKEKFIEKTVQWQMF